MLRQLLFSCEEHVMHTTKSTPQMAQDGRFANAAITCGSRPKTILLLRTIPQMMDL